MKFWPQQNFKVKITQILKLPEPAWEIGCHFQFPSQNHCDPECKHTILSEHPWEVRPPKHLSFSEHFVNEIVRPRARFLRF